MKGFRKMVSAALAAIMLLSAAPAVYADTAHTATDTAVTTDSSSAADKFTDVKSTDYFYEPVSWAVENGITSGTSDTTFSPSQPCNRAQAATFMWNLAGKPSLDGYGVDDCFADETAAYPYAKKAVTWVYLNGIMEGTDQTKFSPGRTCTRAEMAKILWGYCIGSRNSEGLS